MTGIDFHFNVPDKVNYACRLLRKAVVAGGKKVVVTGDAAMLDAVDAALWQFSAVEFIGHCRSDSEAHLLARSPVVIAAPGAGALPHQEVLVNLGETVPVGFERFERLIEVVTGDEGDRAASRVRWRHYTERGYALKPFDVAKGSA